MKYRGRLTREGVHVHGPAVRQWMTEHLEHNGLDKGVILKKKKSRLPYCV